MFERFTKDARSVVSAARAIAASRSDSHVGTEHFLIALASTTRPNALSARLDADALRYGLQRLDEIALASIGLSGEIAEEMAPRTMHPSSPKFTSGAKSCLEHSLELAVRRKHKSIGPDHLIAAITARDDRDPAIALLGAVGIDRRQLAEEAGAILDGSVS